MTIHSDLVDIYESCSRKPASRPDQQAALARAARVLADRDAALPRIRMSIRELTQVFR